MANISQIKVGSTTYDIKDNSGLYVQKAGDTMTGPLTIKMTTTASNTYADTNPKIIFQNANASQNGSLTWTDYDSVQAPASLTLNGNNGNEYFISPNVKATSAVYVSNNAHMQYNNTTQALDFIF